MLGLMTRCKPRVTRANFLCQSLAGCGVILAGQNIIERANNMSIPAVTLNDFSIAVDPN